MKGKLLGIIVASLIALVLGTAVVHAVTITVDGDQESVWLGGGPQTPGIITEGNEAPINDNVDIEIFRWTNDQTNIYFLVDVYAPAPLMPALAPIDICLDTDKDILTTIHPSLTIERNRCSYGTGVDGMDTIIEAYRLNSGALLIDVFDVTTNPKTYLGAGTLGYNPAATTPVVEMSVPLALLGYGPGNCPDEVPFVLYYDGGDTNPDDNLPNSGPDFIDCGNPTAVSLQSIDASTGSNSTVMAIAAALVLTLLGAGFLLVRRQQV